MMDRGKRRVVEEDEEEEPILIEESAGPNDSTVAMCLMGKLWTDRSYNTYGLMETMKKLWGPSQGVSCREMGHNLISFQFKTKRDMKRVIDMEPWHFNKHVLVLKPFGGDAQPSAMKFDTTSFWIRIYDLPLMGRDEKVLRLIGSRFGEIIEIDGATITGINRSVRMKILLQLDKPLKRGTKIKVGNAAPCWIPVTYERLPSFCYYCGKLGHTYKDCAQMNEQDQEEEGVYEEKMPYGDWMRASPMKANFNGSENNSKNKDKVRQSLFHTMRKKQEVERDPEGENHEGPEKNTFQCGVDQVSDLLSSLERVEVSAKNKEKEGTAVTKTMEQETMQATKVLNSTKATHHGNNILHPTTKTVITKTKTPIPELPHPPTQPQAKTNTKQEPEPKHPPQNPPHNTMPSLIPLNELIAMVNNSKNVPITTTPHPAMNLHQTKTISPTKLPPEKPPEQKISLLPVKTEKTIDAVGDLSNNAKAARKTWKRQNQGKHGGHLDEIKKEPKRKATDKGAHSDNNGAEKKIRMEDTSSINSMVEAAQQPRQAS